MAEMPLMPLWVTVFLTIWAAVGPIAGVLIGHYLLREAQRRQWVSDNRLKEWRELIEALMSAFTIILRVGAMNSKEDRDRRELHEHGMRAIETISNRVFIHDDIERIHLLDRWNDATHTFFVESNSKEFSTAFREIMKTIRETAKADIAEH
ncbi:MAG TPA: hypothetical protein VNX26_16395 [Candidatus Acidoferrum sp.]|jgi:hypothetical protein|nr:hypothetical protein [Candidatus Acidoferrum sp.]